jgi:hypothetical protein
MALQKLLEYAEKLAVVGGVLVALLTFYSQTRQVRINNSYLLLDAFTKDISQADLILLESVQLNSHESSGAKHGCFVVFNGAKREQHPISSLFITEGGGLVVYGSLEFPAESTSRNCEAMSDESRLFLGPIRSLAEQLNIIAYETLHGQIEPRVVHYKLGYQIESLGFLIECAMEEKSSQRLCLDTRFEWLIKLRKYLRKRNYPSRSFATGC